MLALFPKVPKIQRLKALNIDIFDYHTVAVIVLPHSIEPPRISAYLILLETSVVRLHPRR